MNRAFSNRYQVVGAIGRGGFADVFKAWDTTLKRYVAIKLLRVNKCSHYVRFKREVDVLLQTNHPNIVQLLDGNLVSDNPYLVEELVEGPTIKELVESEKVDKELACKILVQTGRALEYLHAKGLLHRDIKPENILYANGRAVLMDFNLAFIKDTTALTKTDQVVGTPRYLAPEIWDGAPASEKSDIFSLSLVAYELFGGTYVDSFTAHKKLSDLPGEEKELSLLVAWGCRIEPSLRCPSAKRFVDELEKIAAEQVVPKLQHCQEPAKKREVASRSKKYSFPPWVFLIFICVYLFSNIRKGVDPSSLIQGELLCGVVRKNLVCAVLCRSSKVPSWSIKQGEVTSNGYFHKKDRFWMADIKLNTNQPLILFVEDGQGGAVRREIDPTKVNVSIEPKLTIGWNKVRLSWTSTETVPIKVFVGWFDYQRHLISQSSIFVFKNKLDISAPSGAAIFDYKLFLGNVQVAEGDGELGLSKCSDEQTYSIKPRWNSQSLINVGKHIVLKEKNGRITCFEEFSSSSGSQLKVSWRAQIPARFINMSTDGTRLFVLAPLEKKTVLYVFDPRKGPSTQEVPIAVDHVFSPGSAIVKSIDNGFIIYGRHRGVWKLLHLQNSKVYKLFDISTKSIYVQVMQDKLFCAYTTDEGLFVTFFRFSRRNEVVLTGLFLGGHETPMVTQAIEVYPHTILIRTLSKLHRVKVDVEGFHVNETIQLPYPKNYRHSTKAFCVRNSVLSYFYMEQGRNFLSPNQLKRVDVYYANKFSKPLVTFQDLSPTIFINIPPGHPA